MRGGKRLVTGVQRSRDAVTVLTAEHRPAGVTVRALVRRDLGPEETSGDGLAAALRAAFGEARKQAGGLGTVVAALPARTAVIREAQFPGLSREELVAAIQGEARKHIPLDLREAEFDFQVVSRDEERKAMQVLLVAVPRRNVAEIVEPLARAGAEPWVVDIEPLAAVNALLAALPLGENEALGLLEVGAHGSTFTLVSEGGHFLTRSVGTAYGPGDGADAAHAALGEGVAPAPAS